MTEPERDVYDVRVWRRLNDWHVRAERLRDHAVRERSFRWRWQARAFAHSPRRVLRAFREDA